MFDEVTVLPNFRIKSEVQSRAKRSLDLLSRVNIFLSHLKIDKKYYVFRNIPRETTLP